MNHQSFLKDIQNLQSNYGNVPVGCLDGAGVTTRAQSAAADAVNEADNDTISDASSEASRPQSPTKSEMDDMENRAIQEEPLDIPANLIQETLFEDSKIKINATLTRIKSNTTWSLHDQQVKLNIHLKEKSENAPLLENYVTTLFGAMKKVLKKIRDHFSEDLHQYQVYLAIADSGMVNAIRTMNFSLKSKINWPIAQMSSALFSFLKSHNNFKINSSLTMFIKILSIPHTFNNHKQASLDYPGIRGPRFRTKKQPAAQPTNKVYKEREQQGSVESDREFAKNLKTVKGKRSNAGPIGSILALRKDRYYFEPPTGSKKYIEFFKDKCVLISIILGYMLNLYRANPQEVFHNLLLEKCFFPLLQKNLKKVRVDRVIKFELDILFAKYPCLENDISLGDKAEILSKHYNSNIIIYFKDSISEYQKFRRVSYPEILETSHPRIHLLCSNDHTHIQTINNIVMYMNHNHFKCELPSCLSLVKNWKDSKHKQCIDKGPKGTCSLCFRYKAQNGQYLDNVLKEIFCLSQLNLERGTGCVYNCLNCNEVMHDPACFFTHKSICQKIFICKTCNARIRTASMEGLERAKKNHECGEGFRCKWKCGEKIKDQSSHECNFAKFKRMAALDKLSFLILHTQATQIKCIVCLNGNCLIHKIPYLNPTSELVVCAGTYLTEVNNRREEFTTVNASDENFLGDRNNFVKLPYLNNSLYFIEGAAPQRGLKINQDSKKVVEALLQKESKTTLELLLAKVFMLHLKKPVYKEHTIIVNNSTDLSLISTCLVNNKFILEANSDSSSRNRQLSLKGLKIKFLSRLEFLNSKLISYIDEFGITHEPYFFPVQLISPLFYGKKLDYYPSFENFKDIFDTSTERTAKEKFVLSELKSKSTFNFNDEFYEYSVNCVTLLAKVCLALVTTASEFVELAHKIFKVDHYENRKMCITLPFHDNQSLSGFSFNCLRLFVLDNIRTKIFTLKYETAPKKQVSSNEIVYGLYLKEIYSNETIISNFSDNSSILHKFKHLKPDYAILDIFGNPIVAFFYNECSFHKSVQHKSECLDNKNYIFEEPSDFDFKLQQFKDEYKIECFVEWDCNFKRRKEFNRLAKDPNLRPKCSLSPRLASVDSIYNVFRLFCYANIEKNERLIINDVNSLFPSQMIANDFVLGPSEYCSEVNQTEISFQNNKYCYKNKPLRGLLLVRCYPPRDFKVTENLDILPAKSIYPFISTRLKDRNELRTIYTYCIECSKSKKPNKMCEHSRFDRSFIRHITTEEVNYAKAELNYDFTIFEFIHYNSTAPIYRNWFLFLLYHKMIYTNWPKHFTQNDKENFCKEAEEIYKFKDIGLDLKTESFHSCSSKKSIFKSVLLTTIGKLGTNRDKFTNVQYTATPTDLTEAWKKNSLIDFDLEGRYCKMILNNVGKGPNRTNILMHNIDAVAFSRIKMHKHLRELEQSKIKIFAINNDSIIFLLKENQTNPLPECFSKPGFFKNEVPNGEVVCFTAISPRFYSYTIRDKDGKYTVINKMCGISMTNDVKENFQNKEFMTNFFRKLVEEKVASFSVLQFRKIRDKLQKKVRYVKRCHYFSKSLNCNNRLVSKKPFYLCLPYGLNYIPLKLRKEIRRKKST